MSGRIILMFILTCLFVCFALKKTRDLNHFGLIIELFGPFPKDFVDRCPRGTELFDENGLLGGAPARLHLKDLLLDDHGIDDVELLEFLEACLVIDPQKRPFARELLRLKFVQEEEMKE